MRITKSTKTDVTASIKVGDQVYIESISDKLPRKFGTVESIDGDYVCIRDKNDLNITYTPNIKKVHKLDIDACGDIKASTSNSTEKERYIVGKDFNTKDWWVYDDYTDSRTYYFDTEAQANAFVQKLLNMPNYDSSLPYGGYKPGRVNASKSLSVNDQALQHIQAAIDILGKSGNKDEITKDSIANLGVVMFDLKGDK